MRYLIGTRNTKQRHLYDQLEGGHNCLDRQVLLIGDSIDIEDYEYFFLKERGLNKKKPY